MKAWTIIFLAVIIVPSFAWTFGDDFCERENGESCINSQDCPTCYIKLNVSSALRDTQSIFTVNIKSEEPEELGLVVTVETSLGEEIHYKSFNLPAMQMIDYEFPVMRFELNHEYIVIVRDREINTMWAREFVIVDGLASETSNIKILIPFFAIFAFFGILYFSLKKPQVPSPYQDGGNFVPYIPRTAIGQPQQQTVIEEQIVIVAKKKKYYQKKKKNNR